MGHSQFDDASRERAACNAGKKVGTKRPLTQKQIWAVRFFLDRERRIRDRALFDLAIDSKLRGCDLVKIWQRDSAATRLMSGRDLRLAFSRKQTLPETIRVGRSRFRTRNKRQ
ncbi:MULTISPECIES: integrase [unclassified Mesorhizobium]|uniref:integrase n=1 Tax=unclassified Mesorhizobium TaxID=325217 RepID=UPI00398C7B0B